MLLKRLHPFFRGCSEILLFWKFWKILPPKKHLSMPFKWFELSNHPPITILKAEFKANVPRIFKIAARVSITESLFSKTTEEISGKTAVLKVLENSQINVFSILSFKQLELSNPPTQNHTENGIYHQCSSECSQNS